MIEQARAVAQQLREAAVFPGSLYDEGGSTIDALCAEVERKSDAIQKLWKERDDAQAKHKECVRLLGEALQEATDTHKELAQAQADAARYRWLRSYNTVKHERVTDAFFLGDEHLDAAIDAAMQGETK